MRKLIISIVVALAPFAVWTAGCRQDSRQAAFPSGPEVKNLARAPGPRSHIPESPYVPAAIDPEVLNTPDQPTFARIRAVMDREAQIASRYAEPGLFVLPREEFGEMALLQDPMPPAPAPEPIRVPELAAVPMPVEVPERQAPPLSGREFWSRPAAPIANRTAPAPADVSAMMPRAPLPEAQAPDPIFLPEAIPGLYMGYDADEIVPVESFGPIEGTAQWFDEPVSQAIPRAISASEPLPSLSAVAFESVPPVDLEQFMRKFTESAALADLPPKPAAETKLPPAAALGPKPPEPSGKLAALLNHDNIRQALAPLPDLSANETPTESRPPIATFEELIESAPEKLEAVMAELMPPPPPDVAKPAAPAAPAVNPRDLYMMDFWESKPGQPVPPLPERVDRAVAKAPAVEFSKTETVAAPRASTKPEAETVSETAAPRKVNMLPRPFLEKPRVRAGGLERIDADIEVPPLRF